jgi:hypothetical protein
LSDGESLAAKVVSQTKAPSSFASALLRSEPKTVEPNSQIRSARYLASRLERLNVVFSRNPDGADGRLELHDALSAASSPSATRRRTEAG